MHATDRTVIALALAVALAVAVAVPTALAASAVSAQAKNPGGVPAKRATSAKLDADASDAISARTTAMDRAPKAMASGAIVTKASAAAANPGKGNWWTDADTDTDGKLSMTEAAANAGLHARFTTIDTDKDGFVTQDEYRTYFAANASQGEQLAAANAAVVSRDLWVKLDADSDSKISLSEATGNASLSSSFTAMDGNGDGFVTQAEYTAYVKLRR